MSYKPLPYTYGALTEAEIDAIPTSNPKITTGSTVFNTDTQMLEIYNGRIWLDERSLCFLVDSGVTVIKGNTLYTVGSGTSATGEVATQVGDPPVTVGDYLQLKTSGITDVDYSGVVNPEVGELIEEGNTAGKVDITTSKPNTFGWVVNTSNVSGTAGSILIKINTTEKA